MYHNIRRWGTLVSRPLIAVLALVVGVAPASAARSDHVVRPGLWGVDGAVQSSVVVGNTLYIGGSFTRVGPPTGGLVALDPTSAAAQTLAPLAGTLSAIVPDGNGGWYVGGEFVAIGGAPRANLAHILADGSLDPAFAPDVRGVVQSLALSGSLLYVGGQFSQVSGVSRTNLAVINLSTGAPGSWAPSVTHSSSTPFVSALAVIGSTVYVGGFFSQANGVARSNLADFDAASGALGPWNPAPNGSVSALLPVGSDLLVAGGFTQIAATSRPMLARFDAATGVLRSWNANASGGFFAPGVYALHLSGATLYVGGDFDQIGGAARTNLAAINIDSAVATSWDPGVPLVSSTVRISAIVRSGNSVYIGGRFTQVAGQPRDGLAAVDAGTGAATPWNPALKGRVVALAADADTIFVGGALSVSAGVARNNLAAIDLITGQATDWDPNVNGSVQTMAVRGSTLYIGGLIRTVGGQVRNNIAAIDLNSGALLSWNPDASNTVYTLAATDSVIYVGGAFTQIGGQSRFTLAALDPTTGLATSWNPTLNGPGVATIVPAIGTIWVGGQFLNSGVLSRPGLARFNTAGSLLGWNPGATGGPSPTVASLEFDGLVFYVGGRFTTLGGQPRNNLGVVDTAGVATSWTANIFGPSSFSGLYNLKLAGERLYAGGNFTSAGGQLRNNIAAFNRSSGTVIDWAPDLGGSNATVYTINVDRGVVYAGGSFYSAGNQPAAGLAAIAEEIYRTNLPFIVR
jgi:hypothetical protein